MEITGKVHCFFEQSGTFKNEFIKLGIPAEDYDIQDNFGQTDHNIDLFKEIEDAFDGKPSLFDNIRGGSMETSLWHFSLAYTSAKIMSCTFMDKLNEHITLYNADCMEVMKTFKDGQFDLAIVDPPYGIEKGSQATSRIAKYGQMKSVNDWKPTPEYFTELFRVSKNQIIWGYNHLSDMLPKCKEFLFWYKHQPVTTYSDGELAWTSYKKTAHCIDLPYFGTINADTIRIHPTQKPVRLYEWILSHYAKPGMKILDTFGGSMSSVIACYRGGYDVTCIEMDSIYYEKAKKRVENEISQAFLFDVKETLQIKESSLWDD